METLEERLWVIVRMDEKREKEKLCSVFLCSERTQSGQIFSSGKIENHTVRKEML